MSRKSSTLYREAQRFRQPRVWALLAILPVGFSLLLLWQVVLGRTFGRQPLSNANVIGWTVFLWLVYLWLITRKLVVSVRPGTLSIALAGLWTLRKISLSSVARVEVVTYDPVADYGGYGIRLSKRGRAWIAAGNQGVRLTFAKGGKVLVGSQRASALAQAIETASRNV